MTVSSNLMDDIEGRDGADCKGIPQVRCLLVGSEVIILGPGESSKQESQSMSNRKVDPIDAAPRRSFFGRLAGATALGVAGLLSAWQGAQAASGRAASGRATPEQDGPNWPGKLRGRHRQMVDGYDVNNGSPLEFGHNFLASYESPGAATLVIILRAGALPIALNHDIWARYKIGEAFKIIDPETKAPAVKNPFLHPKPGVLRSDEAAVDRLLASGAIFGACNVALRGQSKRLAGNAGVTADVAEKEWAANLVPGISNLPSGVWGVNRAQEAGCTYCSGGS
jgi:hypothetical protein